MPSVSYIYTVKSVSFDVGGQPFDVSEVDVHLAISTVPEVIVSIAPDKSGSNTSEIHNMSLSNVASTVDSLIKKSEDLTESNLTIVIEKHDALTGAVVLTQTLKLEKWLLVSAGCDNVTTYSNFYVTCTIKHPIYRLCLSGGFFTNVNCPVKLDDVLPGSSNILDAGVKAYNQLIEALNTHELRYLNNGKPIPPSNMSPTALLAIIKQKFGEVPGLLTTYLSWEPGIGGGSTGFPCISVLLPSEQSALKTLIGENWLYANGASDHSVWDAMMSVLSSTDCLIVPKFYQKRLPITPRFPWMPVDFNVEENDVYNLSLPGTDPSPIFGVAGTPETIGGDEGGLVTYNNEKTELDEDQCFATSLAFVPEPGSNANGKFVSVSTPGWLSACMQKGAGYNSQMVSYGDWSNGTPKESTSGGDNEATKHRNDALMLYLSAEYAKDFKKHVEARVNCPFMPMVFAGEVTQPDWIIPTKVMKLVTSEGAIFEGWITTVDHHISCEASRAVTNIAVSYCRPEGGYAVTNRYGYKHPTFN